MQKRFLKMLAIFFLLSFFAVKAGEFTAANEGQPVRGCTSAFGDDKMLISAGEAPDYVPPGRLDRAAVWRPENIEAQLQTTELDFYIAGQSYAAIHLNFIERALDIIRPEMQYPFSETVQAAIDKAPQWLENDLIMLFSHLPPDQRDKWAEAILDATDPYIDEIAFCIAHLSPDYLASSYASAQLLLDNARSIYENDQFLDYVRVVDVGTSASDRNYYSTTIYRKAYARDTLDVEVPKDIYYWYIVHPKITDEIPAYIDPDIVEDNRSHRNNIRAADGGYFWRDFLFNHSDPGYARLKDMLKGLHIVWNKFSLGSDVHAMDVLNRWLEGSMQFTSNEERPHQPVRIYRKHIGRCGEYSDMRVAAARAALIPAASVASYSTDHVWNEFWEEEWIHWDGTINDPYMYVNSWGKEFGSVFRWKSDGSLIPVTDRYTKSYSILNIYALDRLENPIDGARVILYTTGLDGSLWFDTYGHTDAEGKVTFIVGTDRPYYARMSCDYGTVPQGAETVQVISDSRDGIEYNRALTVLAEKPVRFCQDIAPPVFSDKSFYFELDFHAPMQIVRGQDYFDDLDQDATQFMAMGDGRVNCFIVDETNYSRFQKGQEFSGFNVMTGCESGVMSFEFDGASDWFFVFDNSNAQHTAQYITAVARLYADSDPTIPNVQALRCYPNPFSLSHGKTVISYELPQRATVDIAIYNILGQKVRILIEKEYYAGRFQVEWNGKDQNDQIVPTGVYFYRIKTKVGKSWGKLLLVR